MPAVETLLHEGSLGVERSAGVRRRQEASRRSGSWRRRSRAQEPALLEATIRDGGWSMELAPVRKTIYSLPVLRELMGAANQRYLEFLSNLDDPTVGFKDLLKIARRIRDPKDRSHRGFNLFNSDDLSLFEARGGAEPTGRRGREGGPGGRDPGRRRPGSRAAPARQSGCRSRGSTSCRPSACR